MVPVYDETRGFLLRISARLTDCKLVHQGEDFGRRRTGTRDKEGFSVMAGSWPPGLGLMVILLLICSTWNLHLAWTATRR